DGDGYGSISAIAQYACTAPLGSVTDHTDCNDANINIHPSNLETCNGIDDDCDGITDISTLFDNNAWVRLYGGTDRDNLNDIVHTGDGGVLITGYTESNNKDIKGNHGLLDAVVIKLNAVGSIEWQKCYGGSSDDGANAVTAAGDGGFVIAGFGESADGDVTGNNGTKNCWVFKIDATG